MKTSKTKKRGAAKSAGRKKKGRSERKPAAKARARGAASKHGARRSAAAANPEIELEAAVLRRLLRHFDERKDVQNIELMILAGFCRNCLSRWFVEAAQERGIAVDMERARAKIYGMPYSEWKERHQPPATEDQLRRFDEVERRKQATGDAGAKDRG